MKKTVELKSMAIGGGKALLLRHAVGFVINFVGGVILARLLGPEILGAYFISFAVFMFGRAFVDFGILTHFIRMHDEPKKNDIKTAFSLQQIFGGAYLLICIFVVAPVSGIWYKIPGIDLLIISAGLAAYFYSWQSIPLAMFERKMEYGKVGIIEVGEILAFNLTAVGIICFYKDGILGFSIANVLRGVFPALLATSLSGFKSGVIFQYQKLKEILKQVYPVFGVNVTSYIVMIAPPIIMGTMVGLSEYGVSQFVYTFLQYTIVIATIFQRIGLTTFGRLQKKKKEFDKFVNNVVKFLSIIYIPILMGLASVTPFIIPVIYGSKWAGMEKIAIIAAIPLYLAATLAILSSALLSKGKYKLIFVQSILYTVIYWISMLLYVKLLPGFAMPLAHICSVLGSGWLLIYGYNKYCGKINYGPNIFLLIIGLAAMMISYYFAGAGHILISLIVWLLFILIVFVKYKELLPFVKKILEIKK